MDTNTLEQCPSEASPRAAVRHTLLPSPLARILLPCLLVVCSAIPYLFSLQSGFVYDDDAQIVHNQAIRSWSGVVSYFVPAVISRDKPAAINGNYYRPLFDVWLRLNYALFGLDATAWHVASLLLHLAVTLLVFLLLRRHFSSITTAASPAATSAASPAATSASFMGDSGTRLADLPWLAAAGALLFAIHPVHVESVVWASGATDPLAALFLLSALLLWMRGSETSRVIFRVASLFCYAAALLAKETSIILPGMIFVYAMLGVGLPETPVAQESRSHDIGRFWPALRQAIPFVTVSVVYLAARIAALRGFRAVTPWISKSHVLLTLPRVLAFYASHLLWPAHLSLFYDLQPVLAPGAGFWLPLFLLAAIGASACLLWSRQKNRIVPLAFAWLFLPLVPVLDIALFQREDFAHDRYLYLPVIGLAMLVPALLQWLTGRFLRATSASQDWWPVHPAQRRVFLAMITLSFALLAFSTAAQAQFWRDDLALYEHAMERSRNTGARNNLASLYAKMGRATEADAMLAPLVQEQPNSWLANYNFGYVNYQEKRFDLAERYLLRAIALDPSDASQYTYLGLTYLREGRHADAEAQLRAALQHDPSAEGCHLALGLIFKEKGDLQGAKNEFMLEMKAHPSLVAANQLSVVSTAITAQNPASR